MIFLHNKIDAEIDRLSKEFRLLNSIKHELLRELESVPAAKTGILEVFDRETGKISYALTILQSLSK